MKIQEALLFVSSLLLVSCVNKTGVVKLDSPKPVFYKEIKLPANQVAVINAISYGKVRVEIQSKVEKEKYFSGTLRSEDMTFFSGQQVESVRIVPGQYVITVSCNIGNKFAIPAIVLDLKAGHSYDLSCKPSKVDDNKWRAVRVKGK